MAESCASAVDGISENPCQRGEVEQLAVGQGIQLVQRCADLSGGRRIRQRVVIPHDQLARGLGVAHEFVELQLELASVGAEFDDVGVDLKADPAHHLQTLHHGHDVAQRHEIFDLGGGQLLADLVEPAL